MDQTCLINAINSSIKLQENSRYLINGKWGVGKSYIINEIANEENRQKIVVSLFGKSSSESIIEEIKIKYVSSKSHFSESMVSNGKKVIDIAKGAFNIEGSFLELLDIEKFLNNYIIVFDDLERKSPNIKMIDILGVIEKFGKNNLIIVIVNEEKINENELNDYREIKEKVIEKQYTLENISSNTYKEVLDEHCNHEIWVRELINKQLSNHPNSNNSENLRTFIKFIKLCKEMQKELGETKINEDLIKICKSVVYEEINGEKNYDKYFINKNANYLIKNVEDFYLKSELSNNIKRYIEKEDNAELNQEEILSFFYDFLFQGTDNIKRNCELIINKLSNNDYEYFQNIDSLWDIVIHVLYFNEKFKFCFDNDNIFLNACNVMNKLLELDSGDIIEEPSWNGYSEEYKEHDIFSKVNMPYRKEINVFAIKCMEKVNQKYSEYQNIIFTDIIKYYLAEQEFYFDIGLFDVAQFDEELFVEIFNDFIELSDNEGYINLIYSLKDKFLEIEKETIKKTKCDIINKLNMINDKVKKMRVEEILKYIFEI